MESSGQTLSNVKEPLDHDEKTSCSRNPSASGDQKTSCCPGGEDNNELLPCVKKPPEEEEEMFPCSREIVECSGDQAMVSGGGSDPILRSINKEDIAAEGGAPSLITILTRSMSDFLMWMLGSLGILWILGLSRGSRPSKIHEKVSPQKRKQEMEENEEDLEENGMDKKRWRADGVYIAIHDFITRMWGASVGSQDDVDILQDQVRTKENEGSFWKQKPDLNFVANSVDGFEICGLNFGETVQEIPLKTDVTEKVSKDTKSQETESSDIDDGVKKILEVNIKKISENMDDTAKLEKIKDVVTDVEKKEEIANNSVNSEKNEVD